MSDTKLTPEVKDEIKLFNKLDKRGLIHYGYTCKCGFDMCIQVEDEYQVDGVTYPIITGYGACFDSLSWNEYHRCPKCGTRIIYSDGT